MRNFDLLAKFCTRTGSAFLEPTSTETTPCATTTRQAGLPSLPTLHFISFRYGSIKLLLVFRIRTHVRLMRMREGCGIQLLDTKSKNDQPRQSCPHQKHCFALGVAQLYTNRAAIDCKFRSSFDSYPVFGLQEMLQIHRTRLHAHPRPAAQNSVHSTSSRIGRRPIR